VRRATDEVIPGLAAVSVGDPGTPVPDGWVRVRLTDVARMESGHTPSRKHADYWDGDVPWVGIADARVHHGKEIHSTFQTVTEKGLANSAARWLPARTVCLSRTASVGYVTILGRPMATSQDFVNWVCSDAILPEFLMYALLAEGDHLLNFGKGSTHTTIYFPQALAFHLALPPLAEQRRIVSKVEALLAQVNAARERLEKVPRLLKRFRQAVLAKAFRGELVPTEAELAAREGRSFQSAAELLDQSADALSNELPGGWTKAPLKDVVAFIQNGPFGSLLHRSDYISGETPLINPANIVAGRLVPDHKITVGSDVLQRLATYVMRPGDVVVARRGEMGRAALVPDERAQWFCGTGCAFIRPGQSLDAKYLAMWFGTPGVRTTLETESVGATMSNLSTRILGNLEMLIPPLTEQRRIVAKVEALLSAAAKVEAEAERQARRLERAPQAILQKAFSGELVPAEAELARIEGRTFESAAELLARTGQTEAGAGQATARRGGGGRGEGGQAARGRRVARAPRLPLKQ